MNHSHRILRAKKYCEEGGYRFTDGRKSVLQLLLDNPYPMGAYDIIKALSSEQCKINPPTVYRAIDFWIEHGFIHKIQSTNSYLACCNKEQHADFCIFLCEECNTVTELNINSVLPSVEKDLIDRKLTFKQSSLEIRGTCGDCK